MRPGVEDDWEHIGTRIVSGSVCGDPPRGEQDVPGADARGVDLEQIVPRGAMPVAMPTTLASGQYSVMAWAVDADGALYAWSCNGLTSPGSGPIVSELRSVPTPRSPNGRWHVTLADASIAAHIDRVVLRIAPGTCAAQSPTRTTGDRNIAWPAGGEHVEPFSLGSAAPTAFMAWAENDATCTIVARGCTDGPGPTDLTTVLVIETTAPCADPRACRATSDGLACDHVVVEQMAVGASSECFLTSAHEVFCDGSISGAPLAMPTGFVPARLFARHARRVVEPGSLDRDDGYCALATDGAMACWGDAFPFLDAALPTPALVSRATLPGTSDTLPLTLTMGLRMGCVVMGRGATGGEVHCRGLAAEDDAVRARLVGATSTGEWVANESAPAGAGANVVLLASGALDTCAASSDRIWCWGDERVAVATPDYTTQERWLSFIDGHRWTALGVGEMHACGVADDGLPACWGSDFAGQLAPRFEILTEPAACTGLDYPSMIGRDDCAGYALGSLYDSVPVAPRLRSSIDQALASGASFDPLDPPTDCAHPPSGRSGTTCPVSVASRFLQVSAIATGAYHTCAISDDATPIEANDVRGRVLCWGDDELGEQVGGLSASAGQYTHGTAAWVRPCDAAADPDRGAFLEGAVDLVAGALRTCARDAHGDVTCWGSGDVYGAGALCAERPIGLPRSR